MKLVDYDPPPSADGWRGSAPHHDTGDGIKPADYPSAKANSKTPPTSKRKSSFVLNGVTSQPDTAASASESRAWQPKQEAVGASVGNDGQAYSVSKRSDFSTAGGSVTGKPDPKAKPHNSPPLKVDADDGKFPGARKMGMPFKEAVEKFIRTKFNEKIDTKLFRSEVVQDDPKLDKALDNYRQFFGGLPFEIVSIQDNAHDRFKKVVEMGIENAPRRDRDAANRMAKRTYKKYSKADND